MDKIVEAFRTLWSSCLVAMGIGALIGLLWVIVNYIFWY